MMKGWIGRRTLRMDQRWYQSVPRWVYWWMPMDAVSLARETRGSAWQHRGDFQQLEHQAVNATRRLRSLRMFVRCACRITRDTERDKMHVHHNQAALCVERDTLPIAHGWQEKARKSRLIPIFHKKTGFQNTSRESCYQARTYTPTREKNGWMEVVLSRATSTEVPTDRGRSAHVLACYSRSFRCT